MPIPAPFICSLNSSSSISLPAFSIANIIEPELYLEGGVVSDVFISKFVISMSCPFFNLLSMSKFSCEFSFWLSFNTSKYHSFHSLDLLVLSHNDP